MAPPDFTTIAARTPPESPLPWIRRDDDGYVLASTEGGIEYRNRSGGIVSSDKPFKTNGKRSSDQSRSTSQKKPRTKVSAHNDIEKRYRNNLNTKLHELSASLPSRESEPFNDSGKRVASDAPGSKREFKKASVLSRATQYIKQLEAEQQSLEAENETLRNTLMLCSRIAAKKQMML